MNKYSVSPKMPRSGAQSQVFRAPAIFMNFYEFGVFFYQFFKRVLFQRNK